MLFILLFVGTLALSLAASWHVKSTFNKYSKMRGTTGITGAEAAHKILKASGVNDVEVMASETFLGDHYNPMSKQLVLSRENFYGTSPAALGVSAHECGHAIQHKEAYAPLNWRMASVGVTNYANQVVTFLPLIFLATGALAPTSMFMIMAAGWGVIMLFNLITLPVEFDASNRAVKVLNDMRLITSDQEDIAVRKVLNAAGWTYVAAFITSLLYMLYYLLPLLMSRNEE